MKAGEKIEIVFHRDPHTLLLTGATFETVPPEPVKKPDVEAVAARATTERDAVAAIEHADELMRDGVPDVPVAADAGPPPVLPAPVRAEKTRDDRGVFSSNRPLRDIIGMVDAPVVAEIRKKANGKAKPKAPTINFLDLGIEDDGLIETERVLAGVERNLDEVFSDG